MVVVCFIVFLCLDEGVVLVKVMVFFLILRLKLGIGMLVVKIGFVFEKLSDCIMGLM